MWDFGEINNTVTIHKGNNEREKLFFFIRKQGLEFHWIRKKCGNPFLKIKLFIPRLE